MRRWARVACVVGLVAAGLVGAPSTAGATDFGPVDPELADGAAGSLRDIVETDATTDGDVVLLESGATYTLTCSGGGPMVGSADITFRTAGGITPATIVQSCPGDALIEQPATTTIGLENVLVDADTPTTTAACDPPEQTLIATWTTLRDDVVTSEDLPVVDAYRTRVLGVLTGSGGDVVRFDTTVPAAPGTAAFDDAVDAAGEALAPPARSVTAPQLVDASETAETTEDLEFAGYTYLQGATLAIGPGTVLAGTEQEVTWFIPSGCSSFDYFTMTTAFYHRRVQPMAVHSSTYVVYGLGNPSFTG